jgi:hypothetical protein
LIHADVNVSTLNGDLGSPSKSIRCVSPAAALCKSEETYERISEHVVPIIIDDRDGYR